MLGMWRELETISLIDSIHIGARIVYSTPIVLTRKSVDKDKEASFFVGDAAGRPTDHAATDRKWAINVGIPFFTPEVQTSSYFPLANLKRPFLQEYFLGLPPVSYKLPGFHVSSLPDR
jgi:bifunctional polynucleotide phosphatase/kinase